MIQSIWKSKTLPVIDGSKGHWYVDLIELFGEYYKNFEWNIQRK